MKNTLPGFNAEASLYRVRGQYQAGTRGGSANARGVVPASTVHRAGGGAAQLFGPWGRDWYQCWYIGGCFICCSPFWCWYYCRAAV